MREAERLGLNVGADFMQPADSILICTGIVNFMFTWAMWYVARKSE